MHTLFNKLLLCVFALSTIPVQGSMISRAFAKRAVATTKTQLVPSVFMASKSGNHIMTKSYTTTQQTFVGNSTSGSRKSYWLAAGAAAVGVALTAACTNSEVAQCKEKEYPEYISPWQTARSNFYAFLKSRSWGTISEEYINSFEGEQCTLDNKLYALFDITAQEWKKFKRKHHQEFIKHVAQEIAHIPHQIKLFADSITVQDCTNIKLDIQTVNHIQKSIQEACQDIGFDWTKINVVLTDQSMIMATKQFTLIINPALCEKCGALNNDKFKAQIIHEIQHFLHDDSLDKYCMKKFYELNSHKIDKVAFEMLAKEASYFKERRADILAMLSHLKYAQAAESGYEIFAHPPFWMRVIGLFYDIDKVLEKTHPPFSYRYAYIKKVHAQMQNPNGGIRY